MLGWWGKISNLPFQHTGKKTEHHIWFKGTIAFTFLKSSQYLNYPHNTLLRDLKFSLTVCLLMQNYLVRIQTFRWHFHRTVPRLRWHAKLLTIVNWFMKTKDRVSAAAVGSFRRTAISAQLQCMFNYDIRSLEGRCRQTAQLGLQPQLQNAT